MGITKKKRYLQKIEQSFFNNTFICRNNIGVSHFWGERNNKSFQDSFTRILEQTFINLCTMMPFIIYTLLLLISNTSGVDFGEIIFKNIDCLFICFSLLISSLVLFNLFGDVPSKKSWFQKFLKELFYYL